MISIVPSHNVDEVWGECKPMIEKAMKYTANHTIDTVYCDLRLNKANLWIAFEGGKIEMCAVTIILNTFRGRILSIAFVGGSNINKWIEYEKTLEDFARDTKCNKLEGYARKGWFKFLLSRGWKPVWTLIQKEVDHV